MKSYIQIRTPSLMLLVMLLMFSAPLGVGLTPLHAANEAPFAAFSADPTSGGVPLDVHFTDLSTGIIDQWEWDFDDDGQVDSTEQNPVFTYDQIGTYSVSLTVSGPYGFNTASKYRLITTRIHDGSPGSVKWSVAIGLTSSHPAVDQEGVVYIGSRELWPSTKGYLNAINPDGTIKWRYEAENLGQSSSPSIDGNTIYYAGGDGQLYAFEKDGNLKWKTALGQGAASGRCTVGFDGVIFTVVGNGLYAVNLDGSIKWVRSSNGFTTPVVDSNGIVYVTELTDVYHLTALDQDGNLLWKSQETAAGRVTLGANHIYVSGEGLYAFSYGGSRIWYATAYRLVDDKTSQCAWVPLRSVYGVIVGDGVIYANSGYSDEYESPGFAFINPEDGRVTSWSNHTVGGSILGSDGNINDLIIEYYNSDHTLYLAAINPDGSLRLKADLGDNVDCTLPVLNDNTLYFGLNRQLMAVNVESPSVASTDWPCVLKDPQHTGRFEITQQTPTADFSSSVTEGPGPLTVKFTGTYTNAITDFLWDFGDGETSTEPNPTHIYKEDGTFTVSVRVTGPMGEDTATKAGYIKVVPGIRVLSPGSEYLDTYWAGGDIREIKWESVGIIGPVKIELRVNPGKGKKKIWKTLFPGVPNTGKVTLAVNGIVGDFCRIKISSIKNPAVSGTSCLFRIAPRTQIQSPNGGEQWTIGSTQIIKWGSNVNVANVKIDLSRDGGLTWTRIISSAPNNGSASWKVKGPATDKARIRILSNSNRPMDKSNKDFIIK